MTDALVDVDALKDRLSVSPLLIRLLKLQNITAAAVRALSDDQAERLGTFYNFALVHRRHVVQDVVGTVWKFDLALSLAAVLFARERVQGHECPDDVLQNIISELISALCSDVSQPWFNYAVENGRQPSMIAMPSLPALNLGVHEERFYVHSVSDTWPTKTISKVEGSILKIHPRASRRFVDGDMVGDLGDVELSLSDHEISFVQNCSVGWVTQYETSSRTVTIVELDPWAKGEVDVNEDARRAAYSLVKVGEQRLDMYSLNMKMHEDDTFQDNFALSRLLMLDQTLCQIHETTEAIDVRDYIHVEDALLNGLGPVDEEVLLKSLGSITAKNKLRASLALSSKARMLQIRHRGANIISAVGNEIAGIKSRVIRCGADGVYVATNVPFDSILVLIAAVIFAAEGARELISIQGVNSVAEILAIAVVAAVGTCLTYHNLKYKAWALHETIRLRRMCTSDEEMLLHMSKLEVMRTIADAGAKGVEMDGILTCPFSTSTQGRFSVSAPLDLEEASKVGLKLRVSTSLRPVWVDLRGVRSVENTGIWQVCGTYINAAYLEITSAGPKQIK